MNIVIFFTACALAVITAVVLNIREIRREKSLQTESGPVTMRDMAEVPAGPAIQIEKAIGEKAAA